MDYPAHVGNKKKKQKQKELKEVKVTELRLHKETIIQKWTFTILSCLLHSITCTKKGNNSQGFVTCWRHKGK